MRRDEIEIFADSRVRISLRNGYNYTGTIIEFFETSLSLRDKLGLRVFIAYGEIASIVEVA